MKFFISSTYTDLITVRQVAINTFCDLTGNSTGSIGAMEFFAASERTCKEECLRQLSSSDITIGIYGGRYGSIDEETGLSMTEVEFDESIKAGKPILAFVLRCDLQEEAQRSFIQDKVYKLGKSCAHFSTPEEFADRLNDSLKKYFSTLDGFSYQSLWEDIKELKRNITSDLHMEPFVPGQESHAIDAIIDCTENIYNYYDGLCDENNAVFSYAYKYLMQEDSLSSEDEIGLQNNIKRVAPQILRNWESIQLGIPNCTSTIRLAAYFLKLNQMQNRLLFEPWSESLRHEVIRAREKYISIAEKSSYID